MTYLHRKYAGIERTRTGDLMQEIEALNRASKWSVSEEDKQLLNRIKRKLQDELIEGKWLTSGKANE